MPEAIEISSSTAWGIFSLGWVLSLILSCHPGEGRDPVAITNMGMDPGLRRDDIIIDGRLG